MENKTAEELAEDYCLSLHKERAMSGRLQYRIRQDKNVFMAGYEAASLQCAEMKTENERLRAELTHANGGYRASLQTISEMKKELDEMKKLIASDSVYWALRNAVKSPSTLGDVEDDNYQDLYTLSGELKKSQNPQP